MARAFSGERYPMKLTRFLARAAVLSGALVARTSTLSWSTAVSRISPPFPRRRSETAGAALGPGEWGVYSSIPGWTALTSTGIELHRTPPAVVGGTPNAARWPGVRRTGLPPGSGGWRHGSVARLDAWHLPPDVFLQAAYQHGLGQPALRLLGTRCRSDVWESPDVPQRPAAHAGTSTQ